MSTNAIPFAVGQKVYMLLTTGQVSSKRFEIVKVWRYPTTFRYQLDSGYVADHAELRALEGESPLGEPPATVDVPVTVPAIDPSPADA